MRPRLLSLALIAALLSASAFAQDASLRYATMPGLATAQALSAAAFAAVDCSPITMPGNCDPNRKTKMNYPIVGLTDGRYAIVIHTGDVFQGEHIRVGGKSFDLTAGQIASLATRQGMGTLLGDILQLALVNSRVTAPELTAITAYANAHPAFKTNWTALISGPIDLQAPLIGAVMNELQTAGILTATRVAVIAAPNPAAAASP